MTQETTLLNARPGPITLRISSREPILEHDGLRIRVKNIFTLELPTTRRRRGREEEDTLDATIPPSPNQGDFFADPLRAE